MGQPRGGGPDAAYAAAEPVADTVDLRRVAYDIDRVVEAVSAAELPERIGTRLHHGK